MRIGVVINPVSGSRGRRARSGQDRVALARRFADRRRTIDLETVVTTAPGHAIELARGFVARQFDVVIAWGGDGTANEVAGPLIGTTTALGIVAEGSGDGFARGLGLPRDADAALAAAIDRPGVPVDVGYFGGRHFLNVAGVGFDAEVAHAFSAEGTSRGGLRHVPGLQLAWSLSRPTLPLTLDGRHSDGRSTFWLSRTVESKGTARFWRLTPTSIMAG
jgi:diacylglycerol kinase family enzyme